VLKAFRIPIGWKDLVKRTFSEMLADNCFGLAAQLAYYFFVALFPALLFLVALASFLPVGQLTDTIWATIGRVAPTEVFDLVMAQVNLIAKSQNGGLLTLGMIGTIWSTSSGVTAIIDTLNQAYDVQETRSWWKVRLLSLGLTVAIALFIVVSFALVITGPSLGEKAATWLHLGPVFAAFWTIIHWPLVFSLVALAVAMVYYYAPDAELEWIWRTPGSVLATLLWIVMSVGFKFYVSHFTSYNATYGAIGAAIVALLYFYVSSLAVLIGAELNSEIEHASPYGKDPGERVAGDKERLAAAAERSPRVAATANPALAPANCDVDAELPQAPRPGVPQRARFSDWVLSGLVLTEFAAVTYARLRRRLRT
jgi:membrane protein